MCLIIEHKRYRFHLKNQNRMAKTTERKEYEFCAIQLINDSFRILCTELMRLILFKHTIVCAFFQMFFFSSNASLIPYHVRIIVKKYTGNEFAYI